MANITDKDEPVKDPHSFKQNPLLWIISFVLLALIIVSGLYHRWVKKNTKVYKGVLIEKYGVHKKTFAKWMRWIYFQDENKFQEYTKKKKLSLFEIEEIINFFGEPTPTMSILTKGKIIADLHGTYETLRSTVIRFSDKIGLSVEAYDAIDVFPPLIAQRILKHF